MKFDTIFIIGPQGAGKGTQGKMLAEKLGFFNWEMGKILRDIAASGTPVGKEIAAIQERGDLVTDEMLIEVVKERLPEVPAGTGIIFDGIPRRMGQAQFLLDYLEEQKRLKPVTVFIDLPKEESVKRLLLRSQKENRSDDTPEAIETRLHAYDEIVKPVIEYLKTRTVFLSVDGRPPIEEVANEINAALETI